LSLPTLISPAPRFCGSSGTGGAAPQLLFDDFSRAVAMDEIDSFLAGSGGADSAFAE